MLSVRELVKQSKAPDLVSLLHPLQIGMQGVWIARDVDDVLKISQQLVCLLITTCIYRILSEKHLPRCCEHSLLKNKFPT